MFCFIGKGTAYLLRDSVVVVPQQEGAGADSVFRKRDYVYLFVVVGAVCDFFIQLMQRQETSLSLSVTYALHERKKDGDAWSQSSVGLLEAACGGPCPQRQGASRSSKRRGAGVVFRHCTQHKLSSLKCALTNCALSLVLCTVVALVCTPTVRSHLYWVLILLLFVYSLCAFTVTAYSFSSSKYTLTDCAPLLYCTLMRFLYVYSHQAALSTD